LKSASTKISLVTDQWVTRGLFKRLDGVIAWPEETAYLRLFFDAARGVLQFLRVRYA
jgi:hypothetical protein